MYNRDYCGLVPQNPHYFFVSPAMFRFVSRSLLLAASSMVVVVLRSRHCLKSRLYKKNHHFRFTQHRLRFKSLIRLTEQENGVPPIINDTVFSCKKYVCRQRIFFFGYFPTKLGLTRDRLLEI